MKRWGWRRVVGTGLAMLAAVLLAAGLPGPVAAQDNASPRVLTLQESVEVALQNNVRVRQAEQELAKARLQLEQARAAGLMQPDPVRLLQAEEGVRIAEHQRELTRLDVAVEVESDYYNILRLRNLIQVLEEATAVAHRYENIAQQRLAVGSGTRRDLLAAQLEVARNERELANVRGSLELALTKYRKTVGVPDAEPAPLELGDTAAPSFDVEQAIQEAFSRRVELMQLQVAVEAAEKALELATNDYTPGLTRELARVQLALNRLQLEQAYDGIELEVRQAHRRMQEEHSRIAVTEKQVAEAEERVRVMTAMFEADMATQVELMEAQTALTSARTEAVNARFDTRLAIADFFRTMAWTLAEREAWEREHANSEQK